MSNVIVLLIFVLPGILAEKISHLMDFPKESQESDFGSMVTGLILTLPIIALVGLTSAFINNFKTLDDIISAFNNLWYLFTFSAVVFVLAVIVGIFKGLSNPLITKCVNYFRSKLDRMDMDDKSCWRVLLLDENVSRYVKVIKDGEVLTEGFGKAYSLPGEERQMVLEDFEQAFERFKAPKEYIDEVRSLLKLWRTYVDIEKGVIVEVYDTTESQYRLHEILNGE